MTIKTLVAELRKASKDYYNKGKSKLTDEQFDKKIALLKKRKPNHPFLKEIGAAVDFGKKVKLPIQMGSLVKERPSNIAKWASIKDRIICTPKLDGLAGVLHYKDGKLKAAYTRGDGIIGRDVTVRAKNVQGVVTKSFYMPKNMYVAGEFVIHNTLFEKHFKGDEYKNPRNFVVGMLNRKGLTKKDIKPLKRMTFVAYKCECDTKDFDTKLEELDLLSLLNFTTVSRPGRVSSYTIQAMKENPNHTHMRKIHTGHGAIFSVENTKITEDFVKQVIKYYKHNIDILTDGAVVEYNSHKIRDKLGNETNSLNPKYARAIKLDQQDQDGKVGTVKRVDWNYTKKQVYKPVMVLKKSLDFNGVSVDRIYANNAAFIKKYKIQKGTKIKVIRSGEVIPYPVEIRVDGKWIRNK